MRRQVAPARELPRCATRTARPRRASTRSSLVATSLVDVLLRVAARTPDAPAREALLLERARLEDLNADELQDYFADECVAAQRHAAPEAVPGSQIYPAVLPDRLGLDRELGRRDARVLHARVRGRARQRSAASDAPRRTAGARTTSRRPSSSTTGSSDRSSPSSPSDGPTRWCSFPTGSLRGVPVGALRDARSGKYLVEATRLAVAPGGTLTAPGALPGAMPGLKAGLGGGAGLPGLVSVPTELAAVDRLYPDATLLNEHFCREGASRARSPASSSGSSISRHTRSSAAASTRAFIPTYDGRLGVDRLAELVGITEFREQPLELLSLSACQTAAGSDRAALGLAGIAVKAGARSTVASLWYIEDQAAGQLMAEFYRELAAAGVTRAEALRRAQRLLLADPATRNPASWAPFLLIGSWL
jgi:CHAT domain-containing protein